MALKEYKPGTAFTGFVGATLLEAGNARRAMYQASEERKGLYVSPKAEASECILE